MNYREADKFLWGLSFKKQLKRDIENGKQEIVKIMVGKAKTMFTLC